MFLLGSLIVASFAPLNTKVYRLACVYRLLPRGPACKFQEFVASPQS